MTLSSAVYVKRSNQVRMNTVQGKASRRVVAVRRCVYKQENKEEQRDPL